MMKQMKSLGIDAMWFVTEPTKDSEVVDIVFKIETWRDLSYQFVSGLDPDDILDTFDNAESARGMAKALIDAARLGILKGRT